MRERNQRRILLFLVLAALVTAPSVAGNALQVWVEGEVTSVSPTGTAFAGIYSEGDRVSVTITFDELGTGYKLPGNPGVVYVQDSGSFDLFLVSPPPFEDPGLLESIRVMDRLPSSGEPDLVDFRRIDSLPTGGSATFNLIFEDPSATMLSSYWYPELLPVLSSWPTYPRLEIVRSDASLSASVDSITVVPEPGSLILAGAGLLGLGGLRRARFLARS